MFPAGGHVAPWSASHAGGEASRTLAEGSTSREKGREFKGVGVSGLGFRFRGLRFLGVCDTELCN